MSEEKSQYSVQPNTTSCFIARICEVPGEDFANNGILWVDIYDLDGSVGGPPHGQSGTTQRKAIASWTIRSAFTAWNKPPKILYKGRLKVKGKVKLNNAMLSKVNISGGPPMQGTATSPVGPGTATIPVLISNASGTANLSINDPNAELEIYTDGDELDIELISQPSAQLPWCVAESDAEAEQDVDKEADFIRVGDLALYMAFGNSLENLYVVDIFR